MNPPKSKTPTKQQFEAFENAYQYFNVVLFGKALPPVILNLSRKSKAMGFVAPFRWKAAGTESKDCLLYTSPSPRDRTRSRMPSSA